MYEFSSIFHVNYYWRFTKIWRTIQRSETAKKKYIHTGTKPSTIGAYGGQKLQSKRNGLVNIAKKLWMNNNSINMMQNKLWNEQKKNYDERKKILWKCKNHEKLEVQTEWKKKKCFCYEEKNGRWKKEASATTCSWTRTWNHNVNVLIIYCRVLVPVVFSRTHFGWNDVITTLKHTDTHEIDRHTEHNHLEYRIKPHTHMAPTKIMGPFVYVNNTNNRYTKIYV